MQIRPYLGFDGRCAEAFRFYETTFGGRNLVSMPYRGTPMETHVSADWLDKVLHAQMDVGNAGLMGSDAPAGRYRKPEGITVSIQVTDIDEAERVFAALAEGGSITMPLMETFWAKRFGMVTDRFAIPWMINCE